MSAVGGTGLCRHEDVWYLRQSIEHLLELVGPMCLAAIGVKLVLTEVAVCQFGAVSRRDILYW